MSLIPWRVPTGFVLSSFTRGMERKWASIETVVGEFSEVAEAERYFSIHYVPFQIELSRRMLFARAKDGTVAGTMTAWWNHTGSRWDPSIHWLAVHPKFSEVWVGSISYFRMPFYSCGVGRRLGCMAAYTNMESCGN